MDFHTIRSRTTFASGRRFIGADVERNCQACGETDGETAADWSDQTWPSRDPGSVDEPRSQNVTTDETWAEFRAFAAETGLTVASAARAACRRAGRTSATSTRRSVDPSSPTMTAR